ncbi:hypothetical protein Pmar_PMAR028963 [Perkinsus marinus ATCC 50983]|uniref:subtilisin n=1 Tax=Perkinsus marinus (strain ATCC 50983 / TXsc) TaxID=423536 RepID=C5L3E4_PERM5|nr:hypothetical protein Pmar_PMAR028963 [Perkinsus marinus ATCC 50983]EER08750.1 hypothetical protein Pmar_PMAR028963 [Perkinsus marinus ATCC 50983]|eukprot:XP_002776934.1 hypothetical protein Pmar_PMAR028963 [Perkinsus marinus ATCC 50983]
MKPLVTLFWFFSCDYVYVKARVGGNQHIHSAPKRTHVTIAIIDNGIEASHPDLEGVVIEGYNIVDDNSDTSLVSLLDICDLPSLKEARVWPPLGKVGLAARLNQAPGGGKHLGHGVMAEEGLLIWNRLGLGHESLDGFLRDSLRRMPESYKGCRRKLNADAQRRQNKYQVSQIIDRVLSNKPNSEVSASQPSMRSKLPNAGDQCSDDDSDASP